ncbi:MAG TPA: DUF2802 domain-containing protein [Cellvibrio sp.]|nr:DUF2802 domain-containing protein [Cellvibrio sp.]
MALSPLEIGLILSLLTSVIALVVAAVSLILSRRRQREAEQLAERLAREISLSTTGVVSIGQRLLSLERRVHTEAPQAPAVQKIDYYNNEDFQPYSQAAQLLQMGLETEEVARRCGLSRAETSLIQMMQAKTGEVKQPDPSQSK